MARFLGAWLSSLAAVALVAALILGRDEPPRTYQVAAIAGAFDERYQAALADLEAGGVLYLRGEQRGRHARGDGLQLDSVFETWVGTSGTVPVARSEQSDASGQLLRVTEIEGVTRTLLVDNVEGTESRAPATVLPVQPPAELLRQLFARTLGAAPPDREVVGAPSVAGLEAAHVSGSDTASTRTAFAVADPLIHRQQTFEGQGEEAWIRAQFELLQWAVLPPGTPLGTRPD